jgi:hypothetical protein
MRVPGTTSGGHCHFFGPAFEEVCGVRCTVSALRAKRRFEGEEWKARVWDGAGEDLSKYSAILIGDTVATGTTLCGTTKIILERIAATGKPYPDIYVWAIAGSTSAAEHPMLLEIDALLKANGKKLHLHFANARSSLNENGTDLQFFDADYNERAEKEIKAKPGAFLPPKMRCAVWDWGDRFREIRSHLEGSSRSSVSRRKHRSGCWLDGRAGTNSRLCGGARPQRPPGTIDTDPVITCCNTLLQKVPDRPVCPVT